MKQMDVRLLGQSYTLGCEQGGEASLLAAVAEVDREMSEIQARGKVKARERIAVLAALNLASRLADRPESSPPPAQDSAAAGLDIDALIRKVDHALSQDGQLL